MRALSTAALLEVWERGLGRSPFQRALLLLAAGSPNTSADDLAQLPIGQRDGRLLTLRELTFGPRLTGLTECRQCGARLEFAFDAADTRTAASVSADDEGPGAQVYTVVAGGGEAHYRLPTSADLAAVAGETNIARARRSLLARCVLDVVCEGEPASLESAPPELIEAVVRQMGQVDPLGDLQMTFTCPSCGHQREVAFDITSFFWEEIEAWASRTLRDVHTLATAYGWREADILAMNPRRRQHYLDLVGA